LCYCLLLSMTLDPVDFAIGRLLDYYPNLHELQVIDHPEMSACAWLRYRIQWGLAHEFVWFTGDKYGPTGVLMIRPVTRDMISIGDNNYWRHVWDHDPLGDICFVDFAFGPGLYHEFIRCCKLTRRPWICYRHNERLRLIKMSKMRD